VTDKLLQKMQDAYDRIAKEAAAGVYGQRYIPPTGDADDNPDTRVDFPYVDDPAGYKTHVPLEQDEELKEAEGDAPTTPAPAGADAGAELGGADMPPPEGDTGGIGDMGMDASGNMPGVEGGAGMPGMGEQEEKLTSNQLGRVYELKKIYSRLASVESFISRTTDDSILEIRKLVSQSIDLFELVISNFDQYKDKVDEIIVTFYEFLDVVYGSLKTHFAEMSKKE